MLTAADRNGRRYSDMLLLDYFVRSRHLSYWRLHTKLEEGLYGRPWERTARCFTKSGGRVVDE
jgi:hypothetical protein